MNIRSLTFSFAGLASIAGLLALSSGCVYVGQASTSDSDLQATTNRIAAGDIPAGLKAIEVDNSFGPLRIVATDAPTGHWAWNLTVQARTEPQAREWAEAARCAVTTEGDTLRVTVLLPQSSEHRRIESTLEIQVPKAFAVRASDRFGSLVVRGVSGDVEARNQNGSLELRDLPGKVHGDTSFANLTADHIGPASLRNQNGELEVSGVSGTLDAATSFSTLSARNIGSKTVLNNQNGTIDVSDVAGPLEASTSFASLTAHDIGGQARLRDRNGHIEAERIHGDADIRTSFDNLRAESIDGDATLANQNGRIEAHRITGSVKADTSFASMSVECSGHTLDCHNQNGSLRARALSRDITRVDAETSFASLELRLPAGVKPAIQAHTSFAEVDSDFPVIMKPRGAAVSEDLEAGSPVVSLHNQNGSIRVIRDQSVAAQ